MEGSIFSTLTSNELGIYFTGLGVALSAILSGIGSAIGVGKAGQAAAGVIADQPERFELHQGFAEPERCEDCAAPTVDGPADDVRLVR